MLSLDPDQRMLSKGQAGRLLGLTIREMNVLRETGSGPAFVGTGEYVVYPSHTVRAWAMNNVHAPTLWFDRFFYEDVNDANRTRIMLDSKTSKYYLSEYEEAWLLFKMGYESNSRVGEGSYRLYMKNHPVKQREVLPFVLQRRQAIAPTRNLL